jgi:hypothetical protein
MDNKAIKVIKYFSFFAYYPTFKEIYTFLEAEISKNSLKNKLDQMLKDRKIFTKYTPPQYSIGKIKDQRSRRKNSQKKLDDWRFRLYRRLIYMFPQIKLVGLSGSVSMMNANTKDDIDLFIITEANRLFTGRLIALVLAQILGLRRHRGSLRESHTDKVCLNLFFDENDLKVPRFKQTEFVGHEVLQMKPLIDKNGIYERFLTANRWVFKLFPNAKQIFNFKPSITNEKFKTKNEKLGNWLESKLKSMQMKSINTHKTTEIITNTQLWFHPDDFEKKLIGLDKTHVA